MVALAAIAGFLTIAFYIALFVGQIMLIVSGFKKDTTWGVCNLLVPFASLVFMIKFWKDEAQPGGKVVLISLIGTIVCVIISLVAASSAVAGSEGAQEFMQAIQEAAAEEAAALEAAEEAAALEAEAAPEAEAAQAE